MGVLPFVLAAAVVTGPIIGGERGQPCSAMPPGDLTHAAYAEAEYVVADTAHAETPRWVADVPPPLDMGQGWKGLVTARRITRW